MFFMSLEELGAAALFVWMIGVACGIAFVEFTNYVTWKEIERARLAETKKRSHRGITTSSILDSSVHKSDVA